MLIKIGPYNALIDYTPWYSRAVSAMRIEDSFDNTTRSSTCTVGLVDPVSIPKPYEVLEVYEPDALLRWSGVVKSVTKRVVSAFNENKYIGHDQQGDPIPNPDYRQNVAVYEIVADSWEVEGANFELIQFEEYYSKTLGYIVKDIVSKYLPHLDGSSIADAGPTFERVIMVMRRPNEAITTLCEKAGYKWWVSAAKVVNIAEAPVSATDLSPVVLSDISEMFQKIDLQLVDNIENRVNDLFLRSDKIRGALVQEMIPADGFTGNYTLKHKPWGLADVVPIVDEFAGGDVATYPDSSKWKVLDPTSTEHNNFTLQDGRLQITKGGTLGALISKQLIGTNRSFVMRDLEVEFTSFDAADRFLMGIHTGETSTSLSKFLLAIQVERNDLDVTKGDIKIRKGGVISDVKYTMDFNIGDPKPYQFKIVVTFGAANKDDRDYFIYLQTPDELAKGSGVFTLIDSGTFTAGSLPAYVGFCPAYTEGGVEGTVIQGSVTLRPDFYASIEELQFISSIAEKDKCYISCEHANWSKWTLGDAKSGLQVIFYNKDGTEFITNPNTGQPYRILGNNTQQFWVESSPTDIWFNTQGIISCKIQRRYMNVSNGEAQDYDTHCFIEMQQDTPVLRFYQQEVPCGWLSAEYWAEQPKTLEVYDQDSIDTYASESGIEYDTGKRKQFEAVDTSITTVDEMLLYAEQFLNANGRQFVQGTFETHSNLVGQSAIINAGMTQVITDMTIGTETITGVNTYISKVSIEHVGANQLNFSISLGDMKDVMRTWFIAKLNALHQESMVIDDLSNSERVECDDRVEIDNIDLYGKAPIFYNFYYDAVGITLRWYYVGTYTTIELRTDKAYGTDGDGLVYRGTGTEKIIAGANTTRRKYTFYAYGIDSAGRYTAMPNVCTVENKQPTTTPLRDILVDANGLVTVLLTYPLETDVVSRKIYVNNAPVTDDELADSDMIFTLAPWELSAQFIAYDAIVYVTIVEEDVLARLDTKPVRFDRIVHTDVIALPPELPTGFYVDDSTEDATLQKCQIKLHIPYTENAAYGKPEVYHVQFSTDNNWPDPNSGLPNGSGSGILEQATGTVVKLPEGSISGIPDINTYLLVLKRVFYPEGSDPVTQYLGRFIDNVVVDGGVDVVTCTGGFFMDAADDYDWELWRKWYEAPSVDGGWQDYPVNPQQFIFVQNEYQFIREMANFVGYARVYAVNKYGLVGAVVDNEIFSTTEVQIDTDPAPLVTDFTVSQEGFTLADGSQKVQVTCSWNNPIPEENFSHVMIVCDQPVEAGMGMPAGQGGYAGEGYFSFLLGHYYDSGQPFITNPTTADVIFYCISVNNDGYYAPDWYTRGKDMPGGYREQRVTLVAENSAPPAVDNLEAEYPDNGGAVNVIWDASVVPDLAYYDIEYKTATTELDLDAAAWTDEGYEGKTTFFQYGVPEAENGNWYKFRVRAVDNTAHLGAWAESNNVQAYCAASLQHVLAPAIVDVGYSWEYQAGVAVASLSPSWTNPADVNYGGCEVWLLTIVDGSVTSAERWAAIDSDDTSTALNGLIVDGRTVRIRLVPYNKTKIVPDYTVFSESEDRILNTEGADVPDPVVDADDGIGHVTLKVSLPAWGTNTKPYSHLKLYMGATDVPASSTEIPGNWPAGYTDGNAEYVYITLPYEVVSGLGFSTDTQYYFFAKLVDNHGNISDFSTSHPNNSAMFLGGTVVEQGHPDFSPGATVAAMTVLDKTIRVNWNAPTINGDTVYLTELQISTSSSFTPLIVSVGLNCKSGAYSWTAPAYGTYYVRLRFRNNSTDTSHGDPGYSPWFGKTQNVTYSQVLLRSDGGGTDTGVINGQNYLDIVFTNPSVGDGRIVKFKMDSAATNCNTWWNTTALWMESYFANDIGILDDENASNLIAGGTGSVMRIAWDDYDSAVTVSSTGAPVTPGPSWIGKVIQYYNTTTSNWIGGIVMGYSGQIVYTNVNWGPNQLGKTGRVFRGYWERPGVSFHEFAEECGNHMVLNTYYFLNAGQPINVTSGYRLYVRLIPHNIFGPGTVRQEYDTTGTTAQKIQANASGYANDTVPVATFSGNGSQWDVAANNSVDLLVSFTLTHNAQLDPNLRPDSIVIVAKIGASAPTDVNDNTNTRKFVFPVTHLSGAQGYLLKCPGFDPFTAYSYKAWHAKNCASGMVVGTASVITVTNIKYTSGSDLLLAPIGASGLVKVMNNSATDYAAIAAGQVIFYDVNGVYCASVWQSGSDGGLRFGFSHPNVDPDNELQITRTGSEFRLQSGAGHIIRAFDAPMQAARFVADYSGYASPFIMGSYFIWVDTSGKLRIKSGAPTGDTDGTVVGTQS